MTKILLFIDWFSPGYRAGGPTRSIVNLVAVLKENFDFWIITRNTDYCDPSPYPGIQSDTWIEQDGYHIRYLSSPSMLSIRRSIHTFLKFSSAVASAKADSSPPLPTFTAPHLPTPL